MARTQDVSHLLEAVKSSSSRWLKGQHPDLNRFAWQRGYGAFSVGPTDSGALCRYIDNQEAHHRERTFKDEFRAFLKKYKIDYDENYVWD
jgi:REP element-mobilizing transposase RayT